MKRRTVSLIVVIGLFLCSQGAYAGPLFENGDFETGNFQGWTITRDKTKNYNTPRPDPVVIDSSSTMLYQDLEIAPYGGQYMARINDVKGGYDTTTLSQTATLTGADVLDGTFLNVDWGTVLVEPPNDHNTGGAPDFELSLSYFDGHDDIGLEYFSSEATDRDGSWVNAGTYGDSTGGTLWYKHGSWVFDLSTLSVGTEITLSMTANDCGLSGHGGYAFLDNIGTTHAGDPVPEPATMLLFGTGIAGLAGARIRRKK